MVRNENMGKEWEGELQCFGIKGLTKVGHNRVNERFNLP